MMVIARTYGLILVTVFMAACSESTNRSSESPVPISDTCEMIAAALIDLGLQTHVGTEIERCTVKGSISLSDLDFDHDPSDDLRQIMLEEGWQEDVNMGADGPGTSVFRMIDDGEYCEIEAGAPAWIDDDDGIRQSDEYFVDANCGRVR